MMRTYENNNLKRGSLFYPRNLLLCILSLLMVILIILGTTLYVNAKFGPINGEFAKCYRSIQLEQGDTLWGIAQEYKGDYYTSTTEYIQEVVQVNQLSTDSIQAGQYLMVPYYSE